MFLLYRKTCQYWSDAEERQDVHVYRNKGSNLPLKRKVLPSLFKEQDDDGDEGEKAAPTESKSAKVDFNPKNI